MSTAKPSDTAPTPITAPTTTKDVKDDSIESRMTECSVCLNDIPTRFMVGSMCWMCSKQLTHVTKTNIDPATRKVLVTCPHCKEPIGPINYSFHYSKCREAPEVLRTTFGSKLLFTEHEKNTLGVWRYYMRLQCISAGLTNVELPF